MNKNKNLKIIKFPNNAAELERQVEAILFAAEEPLDLETIQSSVNNVETILSHPPTKIDYNDVIERLKSAT